MVTIVASKGSNNLSQRTKRTSLMQKLWVEGSCSEITAHPGASRKNIKAIIKIMCIYGPASLGTSPPPHPMVMGLHSSAPVPLPPVVWVVVGGGGGGGRSCICMYMNVYVWCECMFLVFVYDYDMICI